MTKAEYVEIIGIYKATIETLKETVESLKEDKKDLQKQVFKLQDGLMSVRAPEAYRDYRFDAAELDEPADPEAVNRRKIFAETERNHLVNMESNLFEDAGEMIEMIGSLEGVVAGKLEESESIHGNEES